MVFLIFPLIGIILPLVLWVYKREKIKDVDQVGRKLLNVMITWVPGIFMIPILVFVLRSFFQGGTAISAPTLTGFLIIPLMIYLFIIVRILINNHRLARDKSVFYKPQIPFLGK